MRFVFQKIGETKIEKRYNLELPTRIWIAYKPFMRRIARIDETFILQVRAGRRDVSS